METKIINGKTVKICKDRRAYWRKYRREHYPYQLVLFRWHNPKSIGKPFEKGREGSFKGVFGENHPLWKGGLTQFSNLIRTSTQNRQWRSDIFTRDKWTCQTCGKRAVSLQAHHIKSLKQILIDNNINSMEKAMLCSELWDINNGVTLCRDCHKLTKNYGNKKEVI